MGHIQCEAKCQQHRSAIFAYVLRLTRDPQLAEEVTQDTFVRIFTARDRLPRLDNVKAWIFRVANNLYINTLRKNSRWHWLSWDTSNQEPESSQNFAAKIECQNAIEQALNSLNDAYRAPLLLFGYFGFSVNETAAIYCLRDSRNPYQTC